MNTSAGSNAINGRDFMMLMDDRHPRPPLRFPPVPTPFNMEKPQLTVPDVSLVFDLSSDSMNTSRRTLAIPETKPPVQTSSIPFPPAQIATAPSRSPPEPNGPTLPGPAPVSKTSSSGNVNSEATITMKLIKHLLDMTKAQGKLIKKMDGEIQTLKQNEEKHYGELMTAIKGIFVSKDKKIDSGVQTEALTSTPIPHPTVNADTNVQTTSAENNIESSESFPRNKTKTSKTGSSSSGSGRNRSKEDTRRILRKPRKAKSSNSSLPSANGTSECSENLSTFFRDLKLPPIEEQSAYSSTEDSLHSLGPIDLQDYNNASVNVGPSISDYETSSSSSSLGEGDADGAQAQVQPTATFYRNVLGCVNRILDDSNDNQNGNVHPGHVPTNLAMARQNQYPRGTGDVVVASQQTNINISTSFTRSVTDTTLYGFPSNYLSFATKEYLQRHGLVHGASPRPNKGVGVGIAGRGPGHGHGHNNNNNGGNGYPYKPFVQDERRGGGGGSGSSGEGSSGSTDRILDVTALMNQPKLL